MQQIVIEEYRILEILNYEVATRTPAAWIQAFKQRFSLLCQQPFQLSQRPLLSLVPPDVLARGAQGVAGVYVREQPFIMDSRPSHVGGLGVVSLVSVLGLSPSGWIVREVTQRRFVQSGTRLPEPPQFCARLLHR